MEFGKTRRIGGGLRALNLSTVCWIITGVNFGVARFGANRGGVRWQIRFVESRLWHRRQLGLFPEAGVSGL